MAGDAIPRGLGSGGLYAIEGGVVDTVMVAVPGIMTLEATVESNTEELNAENKVIAIATDAPTGTGSMTWGRIGFAAMVVVNGGETETLGTGPTEMTRHTLSGDPVTAEFKLVVQTDSLDAAGAAYRLILPRAKASPASETLDQNAWDSPTFDLQFLASEDNELIIREYFTTMIDIDDAYPV